MVSEITVHEFAQLRENGEPVLLLDVRQPSEHAIAALPGSVLIPLHELPKRIDEIRPDNGQRVVVYCHHGVRSMMAAHFLARNGVTGVHSLAGGIDAWSLSIDPSVPRY
jgi:rhodanese-related sulfurtransferase